MANTDAFHDPNYDSKRRAAIVMLVLTVLLFGGSMAVNLYQGHRTGAGTGFNDTKVLPLDQGRHFFGGTVPRP
ncbi:MAG TPA: hypothetical protein VHL53_17490 [Acidimicrobiia bacterium]|nr:hypothetical protein [Acidimicrobiia bacterium]